MSSNNNNQIDSLNETISIQQVVESGSYDLFKVRIPILNPNQPKNEVFRWKFTIYDQINLDRFSKTHLKT